MRRGLVVWFDPEGKTKKRFGLKYPVVESSEEQLGSGRYGGHRQGAGDAGGSGSGGRGERPSDDSYRPADHIDVLSSNKDDERSLTLDHASGIEAAARVDQGTLVYELKVPLARSDEHPYAIGTGPGKTIGIGLETPKVEHTSHDEAVGGMGGGGGTGPGGPRGGARGGGGAAAVGVMAGVAATVMAAAWAAAAAACTAAVAANPGFSRRSR